MAERSLLISPNPSHGVFPRKVNGMTGHPASVTISDIDGKIVLRHVTDGFEDQMQEYGVSGNSNGIYFVKIQTISGTFVRILVIE